VDLISFNGSKCYGPKGVGGLFVRPGFDIEPLMFGGGQEDGKRPGTENIPLIVGMTEAIKLARQRFEEESRRLYLFKQKIISTVEKEISDVRLNSSRKEGLPNVINFSFPGAEGESLVLYLDNQGFGVSTGSACSAADLDPSHVLLAIGLEKEVAHTSLRISLGRWTNEEGVEKLLGQLPKVVQKVRAMSAL
jgi:cysteine desulfurase